MSLAEHFIKTSDGKSHGLKYGHAALRRIEQEIGKSISEIVQDMGKGKVGVEGCAVILMHGVNAFNRSHSVKESIDIDKACDLMDNIGNPSETLQKIVAILAQSLMGESGDAEPAADAAQKSEQVAADEGPKVQTGGA